MFGLFRMLGGGNPSVPHVGGATPQANYVPKPPAGFSVGSEVFNPFAMNVGMGQPNQTVQPQAPAPVPIGNVTQYPDGVTSWSGATPNSLRRMGASPVGPDMSQDFHRRSAVQNILDMGGHGVDPSGPVIGAQPPAAPPQTGPGFPPQPSPEWAARPPIPSDDPRIAAPPPPSIGGGVGPDMSAQFHSGTEAPAEPPVDPDVGSLEPGIRALIAQDRDNFDPFATVPHSQMPDAEPAAPAAPAAPPAPPPVQPATAAAAAAGRPAAPQVPKTPFNIPPNMGGPNAPIGGMFQGLMPQAQTPNAPPSPPPMPTPHPRQAHGGGPMVNPRRGWFANTQFSPTASGGTQTSPGRRMIDMQSQAFPGRPTATAGPWWNEKNTSYVKSYLDKHLPELPEVSKAALIARWAGVESPNGPNVMGGYKGRAVGIIQALGPRRDALLSGKFGDPMTIDAQLAHIKYELSKGGPEAYARKLLLEARTPQEAAIAAAEYERAENHKRGRGDDHVGKTLAAMESMNLMSGKSGVNVAAATDLDTALAGVDPTLVDVYNLAAKNHPNLFAIPSGTVDGVALAPGARSREDQQRMITAGWSPAGTINTGNHLDGKAIDVWPINPESGLPDPRYFKGYPAIEEAMYEAAKQLGVKLGRVKGDLPHWELR